MDRFLDVMSLLSVGLIFQVMYSLRRDHIRVEYSVSWLTAACAILFLSRWPTALERLGRGLGIDVPTALLTLLVIIFAVVLYRLSAVLSNLRDNNIALAQKVAILEYRLEQRGDDDRG
jgi:hypothetical protein